MAMEAGVTNLWYKYVGIDGKVIGTDSFGFSAPGDIVFKYGPHTDRQTELLAKQGKGDSWQMTLRRPTKSAVETNRFRLSRV